MRLNLLSCERQRNGIGGESFYMVRFTTSNDPETSDLILFAVLTSKEAYVMAEDQGGKIKFGSHWRGTDRFHEPLAKAVSKEVGYNILD